MSSVDVAIAGELNLDMILYGLPQELPLEKELLASGFTTTLGSSSAILAHNLASLGIPVSFTGQVGADAFGKLALHYLRSAGVDVCSVFENSNGVPTGITVLLPHDTGRRILTYPGTIELLAVSDLDFDAISSARHFHLSSLFLQTGLHPGLADFLARLKSRGVTISLDTNDDPSGRWNGILPQVLPLVDILLPNREEVCSIANRSTVAEALEALSPIIPLIVVKCGADGAIVQNRGNRTSIPLVTVDVIDTVGAGDSFNAGFLAAWLSGLSPEESARAGNITGALSTTRPGGIEAFLCTVERDKFLSKHHFPTIGHALNVVHT
jgi:sugar/nucleoside kinase (ribokinase family)